MIYRPPQRCHDIFDDSSVRRIIRSPDKGFDLGSARFGHGLRPFWLYPPEWRRKENTPLS